jgi:hypothetical protein
MVQRINWTLDTPITPADLNRMDKNTGRAIGTGADIILELPGFTLSDAEIVSVILSHDIESNATLNVNNTGAVPLYTSNGLPITAGAADIDSALICVYNELQHRFQVIGTGGAAKSELTDTEPVDQPAGGIWYDTANIPPVEGEPGYREFTMIASDVEPTGQMMGAMWFDTSGYDPI